MTEFLLEYMSRVFKGFETTGGSFVVLSLSKFNFGI